MKKKIVVVSLIVIGLFTLMSGYRTYRETKIQSYLNIISGKKPPTLASGLTGKVELQRIISQSPRELVMLISWGEDRVLLSVENWVLKHPGKISVKVFDKDKGFSMFVD